MKTLLNIIIIAVLNSFKCQKYEFSDFTEFINYQMWPWPNNNYKSNDSCVSVPDLIAFHYSDYSDIADNRNNVFPENFCYSIVTYNITREDFFNIIPKNVNAFKNFKKYMSLYLFYNRTAYAIMDDGCVGYLRNIVCYYEFPSCSDNGNGTFKALPVCESVCSDYFNRCDEFFVQSYCVRNSTTGYCAGRAFFISFKYFLPILAIIFLFF